MGQHVMPKPRKPENRGFPKGWRVKHGAIFYRPAPNMRHRWDNKTEFLLGHTPAEAYKTWAERLGTLDESKTINDLFDRYCLEIIPQKSIATQSYNILYIKKLRPVFGLMKPEDLEPQHIYKYLDKRRKKDGLKGGLSIAKREIAMFSDVYTKAVKWGVLKKHPFKGEVTYDGEKGRDRYIENWELEEFLSLKPKRKKDPTLMLQAYAGVKILTGLRQQDLLKMKVSDFNETGIDVDIKKTGKKITIEWTQALTSAISYALSVRPCLSPFVFCSRRGESYYDETKPDATSGFKSIFSRYMDRVIDETPLKERFTEHDLRAKTASDLESIDHAQKLLAHSDRKMTEKYRRKREIVRPAK